MRLAPHTRRRVLTSGVLVPSAAAVVGAAGTGLAACARKEESTPAAPLKTGITLSMELNQGAALDSRAEALRLFEAKYPGIKVVLGNTASRDKLQTMAASGTLPDVFIFNSAFFLQYARRSFLLDLTPLVRRDKYDLSDFVDKSLAYYNWQNKQWGVPVDFPARGLMVNAAPFDERSVPAPPANWTDQTWTWDRFLDAAQKLTRDRNGVTNFGFASATSFRTWTCWLYSNGGEFLNKDATECVLAEAAGVETLQFLQDLRNRYKVWVPMAEQQQGATFELGRIAMTEAGPAGDQHRTGPRAGWVQSPVHVAVRTPTAHQRPDGLSGVA